jgi:hypothetical protein
MLSTEYQLILKILETKDLQTIEKLKITDDFLKSQECRDAYKYLKSHYYNRNTFGHLPSFDLFKQRFPAFPPNNTPIEDSLEILAEDIRRKYMLAELGKITERLNAMVMAGDPYSSIDYIRNAGLQMGAEHEINDDMALELSAKMLKEQYYKSKENKGCVGTPWIWPTITHITGGKQEGQLIYVRGQTGVGKSMNIIADCVHACKNYQERILYYSLEMENWKVNRIAACFWAGINLELCVRGELNPADEALYMETLDMLATSTNINWLTTSGQETTSTTSLMSKIRDFNPKCVVIDTTYQLVDGTKKNIDVDWKTVTQISRQLKQMQKKMKVSNPPRSFYTIAIIQSDKDGDIALAKYIKQDCDLSIKLDAQWDPVINEKYIEVSIDKIRDLPGGKKVYIDYRPGLSVNERPPHEEKNGIGKAKNSSIQAPQTSYKSNYASFNFGAGRRASE